MPAERFDFPNAKGLTLAGLLDLPMAAPRAYALFAHCFTCGKDAHAAKRIGEGLTALGIAVLRFDFTGLGGSEGEFANATFSSNVADLVAAAEHLGRTRMAPALLIGHSLGGAAVLAAAGSIPQAKAVVTIAAPSDPAHVTGLFEHRVDEIETEGEVEVALAGRKFRITRDFLRDVAEQELSDRIGRLRKALLIFHSPIDNVVGIDNASDIFIAAKHPKSFVSLDDADHLLSSRSDAAYVANVISAWAERYLEATSGMEDIAHGPGVTVTETGEGKFQQLVAAGRHRIFADEPTSVGGRDSGLSPYDLLLAALGSCTAMTVRLYADRKGLPLTGVSVDLAHSRIHAEDCEHCETKEGLIDRIDRVIAFEGPLDAETRQRLLEIAEKCPVHRTLKSENDIRTSERRDG